MLLFEQKIFNMIFKLGVKAGTAQGNKTQMIRWQAKIGNLREELDGLDPKSPNYQDEYAALAAKIQQLKELIKEAS